MSADRTILARCKHVEITDNQFLEDAGNPLAIRGTQGTNWFTDFNMISGNVITDGHHTGRWGGPGACMLGSTCSGGAPVLLGEGKYILFAYNIILHGYCKNCVGNFVGGVELGDTASYTYGFKALEDVNISANIIGNMNGWAIQQNGDTEMDRVTVANNELFNNERPNPISLGAGGEKCSPPYTACDCDNCLVTSNTNYGEDRRNDFEQTTDFPAGWNTWTVNAPGAAASRWSPGSTEAQSGTSALRFTTQSVGAPLDSGVWVRGMVRSVIGNRPVRLDLYSREGAAVGKICLVAFNASGTIELGKHCQLTTAGLYWRYEGEHLSWTTPATTGLIAVQIGLLTANAAMDVDLIRYAD